VARSFPADVAFGVIGDQAVVFEKRVDVLAIGDGGDGCGVVQSVGGFGARTLDEPFPREFAGLAVETLREQFAAFEGSQEDVAPREDGRGLAGADGRSPKEVFLFAELGGETSVVRNSRAVRSAEAVPLFRACIGDEGGTTRFGEGTVSWFSWCTNAVG